MGKRTTLMEFDRYNPLTINQLTILLFVFWPSTKGTARIEPALVRACPWREYSFGESLHLGDPLLPLTQTTVPSGIL